ncbi:MAG: hypothetical protein V1697_02545, partial [Candidatus Levyibacteriota bacterium]
MQSFKSKKIFFIFIIPILSGFLLYFFSFFIFDKAHATVATTSLQVTLGPVCGNNIAEGSEECDGTDLNGGTCVAEGYDSGTISCSAGCTFNVSSCSNDDGGGGGGGGGGG